MLMGMALAMADIVDVMVSVMLNELLRKSITSFYLPFTSSGR
jgi:hypothetical protein